MKQEDLYKNKVMLAPMVRVCALPMRLLALDYGADLVYSEEQIDRKLLACEIQTNKLLQTTDFVLSDGTVVFRTCPAEKDRLILQIGTCDPKRALAVGKKMQDYVAGVDVNMGCPKEFSMKGGMGAALLTQPEKVKQILTALVSELKVPVSCKIRVLPKEEDTVELAKLIEATGVSAIAVHGRTKEERSRDANRAEYIKAVAAAVSIPVIANGGSGNITCLEGVDRFKTQTGASSVMLARAAMWNCSVFRKEGPLPVLDVLKSYLQYAFKYDNNEMNTKYCVLQMLHDRMTEVPEADGCLAAKSLQDFADIWSMRSQLEELLRQRRDQEKEWLAELGDYHGVKRKKLNDGSVLIELPIRYDKRLYTSAMTPKQILNNWSRKSSLNPPVYTTTERAGDRYYSSTVLLDGKSYTNPFWEKSKQLSEQSAALSCLVANGLNDGRQIDPPQETQELHRKWRDWISQEECAGIKAVSCSIKEQLRDSVIENVTCDVSESTGSVTISKTEDSLSPSKKEDGVSL